VDVFQQVISIFAATKGFFDTIPTEKIQTAEKDLLEYINTNHSGIVSTLESEKAISAELEAQLNEVLKSFVQMFNA
jgi:F-type H+-transporting ATPase subunit alpha